MRKTTAILISPVHYCTHTHTNTLHISTSSLSQSFLIMLLLLLLLVMMVAIVIVAVAKHSNSQHRSWKKWWQLHNKSTEHEICRNYQIHLSVCKMFNCTSSKNTTHVFFDFTRKTGDKKYTIESKVIASVRCTISVSENERFVVWYLSLA